MLSILRHYIIGLLVLAPVGVSAAYAPSYLHEAMPVFSEPTDIVYKDDPLGVKMQFGITKNYTCVLPTAKSDQDVFVRLTFENEQGEKVTRPTDIYPADANPGRAFKNVLIVGEPSVVGPFLVEVPDSIMKTLERMDIMVNCERPLIGKVYAEIGPFDMTEARAQMLAPAE